MELKDKIPSPSTYLSTLENYINKAKVTKLDKISIANLEASIKEVNFLRQQLQFLLNLNPKKNNTKIYREANRAIKELTRQIEKAVSKLIYYDSSVLNRLPNIVATPSESAIKASLSAELASFTSSPSKLPPSKNFARSESALSFLSKNPRNPLSDNQQPEASVNTNSQRFLSRAVTRRQSASDLSNFSSEESETILSRRAKGS